MHVSRNTELLQNSASSDVGCVHVELFLFVCLFVFLIVFFFFLHGTPVILVAGYTASQVACGWGGTVIKKNAYQVSGQEK